MRGLLRAQRLELDGAIIELQVCDAEVPGGWLVGVWPKGMSWSSPRGDDARLTTDGARQQIAATFDAWLVDAPPFTLAFFGGEAYDTLLEGIGEIDRPFDALVFDTSMYTAFGQPSGARRIADARYAWPRGSDV